MMSSTVPSFRPAPRHLAGVLLVLAFLGAALVGCGKRSEAGAAAAEIRTAAQRVNAATRRLMTDYPRIETELEPLRAAQPALAAARIRAELVPMLDDIARGLELAARAEDRYVGVATGSAGAIESIRQNAVVHRRQAAAYATVRDGYVREATLLEAGPVPDPEARAIVEARVAVLQTLE